MITKAVVLERYTAGARYAAEKERLGVGAQRLKGGKIEKMKDRKIEDERLKVLNVERRTIEEDGRDILKKTGVLH